MITGAVKINDRLVTRLWEKLSIRQLDCQINQRKRKKKILTIYFRRRLQNTARSNVLFRTSIQFVENSISMSGQHALFYFSLHDLSQRKATVGGSSERQRNNYSQVLP